MPPFLPRMLTPISCSNLAMSGSLAKLRGSNRAPRRSCLPRAIGIASLLMTCYPGLMNLVPFWLGSLKEFLSTHRYARRSRTSVKACCPIFPTLTGKLPGSAEELQHLGKKACSENAEENLRWPFIPPCIGKPGQLVLCQPLKLGLNCICTTDFQSVGGNLCRRTGSPSYPKIEP